MEAYAIIGLSYNRISQVSSQECMDSVRSRKKEIALLEERTFLISDPSQEEVENVTFVHGYVWLVNSRQCNHLYNIVHK